jgi:5-methylcytosine-specific restriction endonuclease McrA
MKPSRKRLHRRTALKRTRMNKVRTGMRGARVPRADVMWARAVKERDGYICRRCGLIGEDAHHVATRGRRPDLKHDLDNGLTLCRGCHNWCHANPVEAVAAGFLSDESYELAYAEMN